VQGVALEDILDRMVRETDAKAVVAVRIVDGDREDVENAQAKPLLERALAMREDLLGPEHPDTATSLISLAGHRQTEARLNHKYTSVIYVAVGVVRIEGERFRHQFASSLEVSLGSALRPSASGSQNLKDKTLDYLADAGRRID
jgi:hypothetical protein